MKKSEDNSDSETDSISHNMEYLQDDCQDNYSIIDEDEEQIKFLNVMIAADIESKNSTSEITMLYAFVLQSFQSTFQISDSAMSVLLTFMVKIMFEHHHAEHLLPLSERLPCSTASVRDILGNRKQSFHKYACCPVWFSICSGTILNQVKL